MKHAGSSSEARPVFYVSSRPEAYECYGEVEHEQAMSIAQTIVEHASRRFPKIEFRIDDQWHDHGQNLVRASCYIESHWQSWAARDSAHTPEALPADHHPSHG